jgi:hypothetical protein
VALRGLASTAGFGLLAAVLAGVGALPRGEAAWAAAAVALALLPSGRWGGEGLRRRAAELLLVPAAFALTTVGSLAMRRMTVTPLLVLVAWAAAAAAWRRTPPARRTVLAAALGLAVRAAAGPGLAGFSALEIALALALAAAAPWAAARRLGPRAAELAALAGGVLPWQAWPGPAAAALLACAVWGVIGARRWREAAALGWLPGLGAAGLLAAALASWPGVPLEALAAATPWRWAIPAVALLLTPWLRPGLAGAAWFAAVLALGPALPPTPEHRAFELGPGLGPLTMAAGTGGPWLVDLDLREAESLAPGAAAAVLTIAGEEHQLRADGRGAATVWRAAGDGGRDAGWRPFARHRLAVPAGERPVLRRAEGLPAEVVVRVETIGPARPTPPRGRALPWWLAAAALAVLGLQAASGGWRRPWAVMPWLPLVTGGLLARAALEPLHLAAERLAPDLALAALLAAWLPAARAWLEERRCFVAVAALLVPVALAASQLTPPLYGDEPFHLVVMESLAADHDLAIADDLELDTTPQNALYAPGWPLFHSPGLAFLLLPGYLVGGRAGALALLALMGAATAALLAGRARGLGVSEPRVGLLALLLAASYPLAVFAGQIWAELPGALAVAALLALAARPAGGRLAALAVVVAAAAVKTRLALLTFPVAAAAWLRRRPLAGALALAAAAVLVLGFGWLTMGHPFGPYRRLHHLLPGDARLALTVLGGLAFDPAGGLAFTAPLLLVAALGAAALWRRGGAGERALLLGCGLTVAALLASLEWYGGGAPPGRYLVPALPAFALAGAMLLAGTRRWRRLALVLVPPSLAAWWALVTRPHLSINPGDGGWWLADELARRFAADARALVPSFLVPGTATWAVPLAIVAAAVLAGLAASARPAAGAAMRRAWVGLWLVAAAGFVLTLELRHDRVVELEAPQVRRRGGAPEPAPGTVSRFTHRRGWRLEDGQGVEVPLRLRAGSGVALEGWLVGPARRRAEISVRWNDDEPVILRWRGAEPPEEVALPPPPGAGRHRLALGFSGPAGGSIVLDRLRVQAAGSAERAGGGR